MEEKEMVVGSYLNGFWGNILPSLAEASDILLKISVHILKHQVQNRFPFLIQALFNIHQSVVQWQEKTLQLWTHWNRRNGSHNYRVTLPFYFWEKILKHLKFLELGNLKTKDLHLLIATTQDFFYFLFFPSDLLVTNQGFDYFFVCCFVSSFGDRLGFWSSSLLCYSLQDLRHED